MKKTLALTLVLSFLLALFSSMTVMAASPPVLIGTREINAEVKVGESFSIVAYDYYTGADLMMAIAPGQSYAGFTLSWSMTQTNRDTLTFTPNADTQVGHSITLNLLASSSGATPTPANYLQLTLKLIEADPVIPEDPEPLTALDGDASITIIRPDPLLPYLVNPESAQAKELFNEADILGGTGFNFGTHKYTAAPQNIDSVNSLSMIFGYQDPFNETFTVTCEISDFLRDDGTPIFTDFSLQMNRQNFFADRADYPVVGKASFDLAKNNPVVVVETNEIGHALTNYNSVLKLQQDMTVGLGVANATITWEIAPAVI